MTAERHSDGILKCINARKILGKVGKGVSKILGRGRRIGVLAVSWLSQVGGVQSIASSKLQKIVAASHFSLWLGGWLSLKAAHGPPEIEPSRALRQNDYLIRSSLLLAISCLLIPTSLKLQEFISRLIFLPRHRRRLFIGGELFLSVRVLEGEGRLGVVLP